MACGVEVLGAEATTSRVWDLQQGASRRMQGIPRFRV